jgi:hypothetical protein
VRRVQAGFGASVAILASLLCASVVAQVTPIQFRPLYSKDPAEPIEIVTQKTFGNEADAGSATRGRYGPINPVTRQQEVDPLRSFGNFTLALGHLPRAARASRSPLRLVFDSVGYSSARRTVPAPPVVELVARAVCTPSPQSCPPTESTYIWDSDAQMSGASRTKVSVDGVEKNLLIGRAQLQFNVPADQQVDLFMAIHSFGPMEMVQLRTTVLYGEYSDQEPSSRRKTRAWLKSQRAGKFTPAAVLLAGLAL